MPKRKDTDQDSDEEDGGIVQVDFEFFDPNANDYHATKNLLLQLFQSDAALLNVEALTELLIGQTLVGTTVKTDGKDSDPYAFLSILNLHIHKENASIKALREYIVSKAPATAQLLQQQSHVGFVFSERLINMPVQVVPPMYRMLLDEMQWAIDDGEPYVFSHYVFISRTYTPTAEQEMEWASEAPPSSKRQKQGAAAPKEEGRTHSFHFEDDVIAKHATLAVDFPHSRAERRETESLGVEMGGRLMVLEASKLPAVVEEMARVFAVPDSSSS
ncbi:hypothetical protein EXIGLDRAFT_688072 [Exidia glandulosa HHB12029]|uniref:Protein BCP1 n=1 Tax=Exidia glandulosa HHB12029 TaxID=1314781 RepID=A0A165B5J5_EXIGL|nr:hypothetical protein EXIGLDRAFT_688072 [Exidia glandulosa HHB12029]